MSSNGNGRSNGNGAHQGKISRLYERVKGLHSALPYNFSRSGHALPCWHYYMEVTRRCNLRCKMCQYIDWLQNTPTKLQAEGEMTTEEWLNVIDQTGRLSLITFTGGEVFVRKDFMEIFEHACRKRRVHFISNATMLTEERVRKCIELAPKRLGGVGFNFAGISIDGTPEVHDVIRAQKGAFHKSMKGVELLTRYRDAAGKAVPLVHINTVIQDENLHCLHEIPRIASEAGANVINLLTENRSLDLPNVGHVDPGTFSREDIPLKAIERERLEDALKATIARGNELGVEVRLPRMPFEEILNHYDQGYELSKFRCRAVWTTLYIGAKGGVYPCFIKKVGNVRENTLKEIWNNEQIRAFRVKRRESGWALCRGCCELEYDGKFTSTPGAEAGHHDPATVGQG